MDTYLATELVHAIPHEYVICVKRGQYVRHAHCIAKRHTSNSGNAGVHFRRSALSVCSMPPVIDGVVVVVAIGGGGSHFDFHGTRQTKCPSCLTDIIECTNVKKMHSASMKWGQIYVQTHTFQGDWNCEA